ncbi:PTS glucose transporter subunit IIA [Mycoplasma nasistruthionis]|uniref:PTS glucose transporter subunit IIABC n=1 Tax=Mycoplasma nasistruthionis TaxID=353852 RepID=A0A4Y6I5P6_9MOLU|nr:PTS glucose transporter subunit IIA [Mycoplasma nasistruthionis]QDF64843.1 PTS glucose transporter subunit IIABC [Mycoplasma nasistruthionis]
MSKYQVQHLTEIINAFGGTNNIVAYNNCVDQLRYDLKDLSLLNTDALKQLGAGSINVFDGAKHVQVTFENAEELNQAIKQNLTEIASKCNNQQSSENCGCDSKKEVKQELSNDFYAPLSGLVSSLNTLNDDVLAKNLVGKGFIIQADKSLNKVDVLAPFDAKITMIPANKSQVILKANNGAELVMLFGLDSYKLDGIGLTSPKALNDTIKANEVLMQLDLTKFNELNVKPNIIVALTADSKYQEFTELSDQAIQGQLLAKLS